MSHSEIIIVPTHIYNPQQGQFGFKDYGTFVWCSCREIFHNKNDWVFWRRGFYFSHPKVQKEIREFIELIEDVLGLKFRTKIFQTNLPQAMYVKPASFWNRQLMRFHLFSILMRAAIHHKSGDKIENTLSKYKYSKETMRAIFHLLSGRTYYTGFKLGWMKVFGEITCCDLPKCRHKDRRCRKQLDALLVPSWQAFGVHYLFRTGRWIKKLFVKKKN